MLVQYAIYIYNIYIYIYNIQYAYICIIKVHQIMNIITFDEIY